MRIVIPALALILASPVAAGEATVRQSVNLRAGPGMDHPVSATATEGEVVEVGPCSPADWCEVTAKGGKGWAYGRFLTLPPGAEGPRTETAAPAPQVPAAAAPDDRRIDDFIAAHPQASVVLDGDLVIGAGVPVEVELHALPDSDQQYLTINDRTVLVGPDRRVVKIYD